MTQYAYNIGAIINNHTVSAQPSGSGNYGDMYQLTKADGTTTFYAHLNPNSDDDLAEAVRLVFEGFEVNTSNPLPVAIISGGGGSGSIGTTTTPNVSTIGDPTTPAHQAAVLAPGSSGTYALSIQGVTSGLAVAISAAALPLPSGAATAAKQPALGTAGTASTDVLTVQGIASMVALKVDGSAVTQPVSATALPLPSGAATAAKQPALGTAGTPSSDVLTVQGASAGRPLIVANGGGATPTVTSVSASTTVATALASNSARLGWKVTNDTAVLMYVKLGSGASSSSYTYCLAPKSSTTGAASCEGTETCQITVILASGTGNALVTEVAA